MSAYEETIFPIGNDLVSRLFSKHKRQLLKNCKGITLEIGFGSGLSIPFYPPTTTHVTGLEPSSGMLRRSRGLVSGQPRRACHNAAPPMKIVAGKAELLPFPDNSFNSVVSIFTLCSVTDLEQSVSEIKRVLKRDGQLLFLEHAVQSKANLTQKLQQLIQPIWGKITCGCHVNRDILKMLAGAGFKMVEMESVGYSCFPNVLSPMHRGIATK